MGNRGSIVEKRWGGGGRGEEGGRGGDGEKTAAYLKANGRELRTDSTSVRSWVFSHGKFRLRLQANRELQQKLETLMASKDKEVST